MTLKDNILKQLVAKRSSPVSGQALAKQFAVSRTAVWKAINTLKAEGYQITSTPNRGYALSDADDHLSSPMITDFLNDPSLPVYTFDTIDSTMNEAKRMLVKGTEKSFLIVADSQSAGRGRRGKSFFSPSGTGLYLSLAMPLTASIESAPSITAYAAVCVSTAISQLTGKNATIKWVNDLFIGRKKICGILTEAVTSLESGIIESVVIGIGINIRSHALPEELQNIVGFLDHDKPIRNQLSAFIANELLSYDKNKDDFLDEYRRRSLTIGKSVRCTVGDEVFLAKAVGIDELGGLIIVTEDGEQRILRSGQAALVW